ncbi:hypothetical protein RFI_15348 [Reticulomyxa filosa]|uniref:Uncharacterized protein n=1 Tax=Reticulomyxa filosa TaxID=46433 RepID=X6N6F1_RETFI|nr:hypothetical protein RFI_15348 [Reticulomyxa filosa]|eukprot:ETO21855.1 hypothetical protein RFI_15348 [Reticulomyxa filosa]
MTEKKVERRQVQISTTAKKKGSQLKTNAELLAEQESDFAQKKTEGHTRSGASNDTKAREMYESLVGDIQEKTVRVTEASKKTALEMRYRFSSVIVHKPSEFKYRISTNSTINMDDRDNTKISQKRVLLFSQRMKEKTMEKHIANMHSDEKNQHQNGHKKREKEKE